MGKKYRTGAVIGAAALAMAAAGCASSGSGSTAAAADNANSVYKLSLGTPAAAGEPGTNALEQFSKKVAQDTDNHVLITVYPNNELGIDQTEITAVISGNQAAYFTSSADLETYQKVVDLVDLPYIFPKGEPQAEAVLTGGVGKAIDSAVLKDHLDLVAWLYGGARDLITKNPITQPSQLRNYKMRTPASPIWQGYYGVVGADTNAIAFTDVFTSLETGLVDGLDDDPTSDVADKFYQEANNLTLTSHQQTVGAIAFSEKVLDSMPAKYQSIIEQDAASIVPGEWQTQYQSEQASVKQLEGLGVQVHAVNLQQWENVWRPFDNTFVSTLSPSIRTVYEELLKEEQSS